MNKLLNRRNIIILCILVILCGVGVMFGSSMSNNNSNVVVNNGDMTMPEANAVTDEITRTIIVEQKFKYKPDTISEIAVVFTRLYEMKNLNIVIELLDEGKTLAKQTYKVEEIEDQHRTYLKPSTAIKGVAGKELTLKIYPEKRVDTGLSLMIQENNKSTFMFGNNEIKGTLCFSVSN